jgi:bacteriocin-like protein
MTNDIRELNINELDAVSGGSFWSEGVQAIQNAMASAAPPRGGSIWDGFGSGSGSGMGSGSGSPTCPGCHGPA